MELSTKAKITWCPGCPDFAIFVAFKKAVEESVGENKFKLEDLVAGAGIGCHGKISDYLNVNTINGLHGRIIPTVTGVKVANPALKVVAFAGDGDTFSEGLSHLLHAAQKNVGISVFMHQNETFALTTGQYNSVSPKGFKGASTPLGSTDEPMDPLLMVLSAGVTFVARTYAGDMATTTKIMKEAMNHKGFAFVEMIQPCITFYDTREHFKNSVEPLPLEWPTNDLGKAIEKVREQTGKTPCGIFYKIEKPTFEDQIV